ncbi:PPE family protein [Mycobacterium bourgelatii]|uniref:Putative PPE family protein PPE14 n=1 Tax=Mycobacterium bourgelatii TaxID=1273442 RepID=A0A7I9YVF4_MYCBU|nr:PPE family protein [Mycobacterium bourgelatii]MCV6976289.1 PPE family protein [Mycobacterium bourgelatii]GFG92680.1 putative PPE family protein PPE14 [Mycobacterium bourgelatii]
MDFGLLPPEVNSGRIYAGPGSGSMLAAANAWDGLAAVLNSSAASYGSVISGLAIESWLGPASAAMAAAATPYAVWLGAAATVAEQTANQARSAAAAFDAALAQIVPPPLIAANREQLVALVATNRLGQNTPAIEAIQAEYAEMWAHDAAVMFTYAAASAAASTLAPFAQPAQAADPASSAAGAVGAGARQKAATGAQATLGEPAPLTWSLPAGTQGLPAPAGALDALFSALGLPTPNETLDLAGIYIALLGSASLALAIVNTARPWMIPPGVHGHTDPGTLVPTQTLSATQDDPLSAPSASGSAAAAAVGHAALVGGLTVPHSWTVAAPEIRLAVESLPGVSAGAGDGTVSPDLGGAPVGLLGGMALASLAARGGVGGAGPVKTTVTAGQDEDQPHRKPTVVVIHKPPPGQVPTNHSH